jgi:IclR family KDG regulon transcriptional repressor
VRITEESSALLIREVIQTAAAISMSIGAPRREFMPTTRTMLHCPVRG